MTNNLWVLVFIAYQEPERNCELAKSIRWRGHAAFVITTGNDKTIYIDPFIVDNPMYPIILDDINQVNLVLVPHEHFDHVGNAEDIAKETGATVVVQPETSARFIS